MSGKYDAILHLPHHVSATRARMSMTDRAAQFSPFAALTGYEAAIQETGRLTDQRIELSEYQKALLDETVRRIMDRLPEPTVVQMTWFVPDTRKSGGAYRTELCTIKKADLYRRSLLLADGTVIPMDEIYDMTLL